MIRCLLLYLLLTSTGCVSPAADYDRYARNLGFEIRTVSGEGFLHRVYLKGAVAGARRVHVYLDGDGRPWLWGRQPANDPTPANPLLLELMASDSAVSIYLGRPCYFALEQCATKYWTGARYSREVVASLNAAITRLLQDAPQAKVSLVGYSGGGALAVLMADALSAVDQVLTVSGNLDTDQWTAAHGYTPLSESLNPFDDASLAGVAHWHVVGLDDQRVPPRIARRFVDRHGGVVKDVPGVDHHCCWVEHWPALLRSTLASPSTNAR